MTHAIYRQCHILFPSTLANAFPVLEPERRITWNAFCGCCISCLVGAVFGFDVVVDRGAGVGVGVSVDTRVVLVFVLVLVFV